MRKALILACILSPFLSYSQRWHATLFGGFGNYQGDLQEKAFTLDQGHGAFGLGVKYDLTGNIALRGNFMYGEIGADDKKNSKLAFRNLSFESKIYEANLLGEYSLFDINIKRLTPYVFAGVALYHFNPVAYDTLGNMYHLKLLSTEGQGLEAYPDRKPYKLTQFAIPFGGGIKMRVTDGIVVAYEIGLRKLFTDYLDDVSKTYVDPALLSIAKGQTAVEMSYRGDELKDGDPNYPAAGVARGSAKFKDWYYFHGISVTIALPGLGNGFGPWRGGRNRLDCPKQVL